MKQDAPSKGWIKLHRKVKDSKAFANPEILKLWLLCLCKANHTHNWVHLDGVSDPVEVHPGQFITGRYTLHREYYPTASEKNKSPLTVWRWLEKLAKWQNVNIKPNNKYTLVEIVNWDLYQNFGEHEQETEQQTNNRRTTDEQQMNTNKNDKNDKNGENAPIFIDFWDAYDKKLGSKSKCEAKWKKLSSTNKEKIMQFIPIYKRHAPNPQYRKYPLTFLNSEIWKDDWNEYKVGNTEPDGILTVEHYL